MSTISRRKGQRREAFTVTNYVPGFCGSDGSILAIRPGTSMVAVFHTSSQSKVTSSRRMAGLRVRINNLGRAENVLTAQPVLTPLDRPLGDEVHVPPYQGL